MGMGSFAVNSFVIGYDDLKNICPDEITAIENEQYFQDTGWESLARWLAWDDPDQMQDALIDVIEGDDVTEIEEQSVEIINKYDAHITNLKKVFNKKTNLELYFDHYDEDGGDRYDEPGDKDGMIFCVQGMTVLSPAGEKYKDIITERRWTQYG